MPRLGPRHGGKGKDFRLLSAYGRRAPPQAAGGERNRYDQKRTKRQVFRAKGTLAIGRRADSKEEWRARQAANDRSARIAFYLLTENQVVQTPSQECCGQASA